MTVPPDAMAAAPPAPGGSGAAGAAGVSGAGGAAATASPTVSPEAFRRRREPLGGRQQNDLRPAHAIDVDRILHSRAYTRYIDKTQVFYLLRNDHITHRVIHVQLLSRIARTVGQKLGLDLDLIEAAALGHDLGHPPFGHDGEKYLSELTEAAGLGKFSHAVMSLRFLERLERNGRGLNLTLGVLDAILCHDGESDFASLSPDPGGADFAELDRRRVLRSSDPGAMVRPMTREGCLVRLCDTVSYIGRDFEDAIILKLVERDDLPAGVKRVLGSTNGTIVYRLVDDLIRRALASPPLVAFSPGIAGALQEFKDFNRERIYFNKRIKEDAPKIRRLYKILFETYAEDFAAGPSLKASREFVKGLDDRYLSGTPPAEKARDLIAGMTDEYFLRQAEEIVMPNWHSDSY